MTTFLCEIFFKFDFYLRHGFLSWKNAIRVWRKTCELFKEAVECGLGLI